MVQVIIKQDGETVVETESRLVIVDAIGMEDEKNGNMFQMVGRGSIGQEKEIIRHIERCGNVLHEIAGEIDEKTLLLYSVTGLCYGFTGEGSESEILCNKTTPGE